MSEQQITYQQIEYTVQSSVATITLNRPERLNALTQTMREEMLAALLAADSDSNVRAIIVTGAGRGFCSGGDVKAMNEQNQNRQTSALEDKIAPLRDRVVLAMRDATKPLIAAVNGPAAGAGMNIALACDIRLMSNTARMGQTFARRGLHPDWGGTYFLPRLIGVARAAELIWSGRMIDAQEALQLGIVSEVTEPDALLPSAQAMAASFAAGPPTVIRMSKRAMYKAMDSSLREALEAETFAQNVCAATQDAREGIAAFVEKREPVFTGE